MPFLICCVDCSLQKFCGHVLTLGKPEVLSDQGQTSRYKIKLGDIEFLTQKFCGKVHESKLVLRKLN